MHEFMPEIFMSQFSHAWMGTVIQKRFEGKLTLLLDIEAYIIYCGTNHAFLASDWSGHAVVSGLFVQGPKETHLRFVPG